MKIRKKEGIREAERSNKIVLFNTYTYEMVILNDVATQLWKRITVQSYIDITIPKELERIFVTLTSKNYIEVLI